MLQFTFTRLFHTWSADVPSARRIGLVGRAPLTLTKLCVTSTNSVLGSTAKLGVDHPLGPVQGVLGHVVLQADEHQPQRADLDHLVAVLVQAVHTGVIDVVAPHSLGIPGHRVAQVPQVPGTIGEPGRAEVGVVERSRPRRGDVVVARHDAVGDVVGVEDVVGGVGIDPLALVGVPVVDDVTHVRDEPDVEGVPVVHHPVGLREVGVRVELAVDTGCPGRPRS